MLTGGNVNSAEAAIALLYGAGTGSGIIVSMRFFQWLIGFRAGRLDKQQEHVDAGMTALMQNFREEIDRLKTDRDTDRREMADMREKLRQCEEQHAEARAEVMELRAMLQGYGNVRNEAQKLIAADKLGIQT